MIVSFSLFLDNLLGLSLVFSFCEDVGHLVLWLLVIYLFIQVGNKFEMLDPLGLLFIHLHLYLCNFQGLLYWPKQVAHICTLFRQLNISWSYVALNVLDCLLDILFGVKVAVLIFLIEKLCEVLTQSLLIDCLLWFCLFWCVFSREFISILVLVLFVLLDYFLGLGHLLSVNLLI
jgi:hypothetical protein